MKSIQGIIKQTADMHAITYHEDYSGRGMYGKECIGISGSAGECMQVIKDCIVELHNEEQDEDSSFEMALELIFDYSTDNMGLGVVVYWPAMKDDQD